MAKGAARSFADIVQALAKREWQKSREGVIKRDITRYAKDKPPTPFRGDAHSKEVTPNHPGTEEFVVDSALEKARGPINIDTLNHEIEKPRIMDAVPAEDNALMRTLMERRSKLKSGIPETKDVSTTERALPGEEVDPLARRQEGEAPRLESDPRVIEQRDRLRMIEQLIRRHRSGNAPSSKTTAKFNPETAKDSSSAPRMPTTVPKSQETKSTEAMLNRLWQQEKTEYDNLLTELMDGEGLR